MKFSRPNTPPTLLFIAGEGGHLEQAKRLLANLEPTVRSRSRCVLITDTLPADASQFDKCLIINTCSPKYRSTQIKDVLAYVNSSARVLYTVARQYNVGVALVTGPGFALVPAIMAKALGAKLVVLESWSRFENRSKCGSALYRLADQFWVQHKELLELYPRAIWVGLL